MNELDESVADRGGQLTGAPGPTAPPRESKIAYGLALVAGALLGGVALALLNRKTIQGLQHELENAPPPPSSDEIY